MASRFLRCASPGRQLAGELVIARGAARVVGEVEVVGQLGRFAFDARQRFEVPADAPMQLGSPWRGQPGVELFAVERVAKGEAGAASGSATRSMKA